MLRFTNQQTAFVNQTRSLFNNQQASVAALLGSAALIGNALPMPRDVWGEWDRDGVMIQREVLSVFNDLAATVSTPMPIGKLVRYFQTISDSTDANISLDGRSKGRTDQEVYDYHGTPLPIIDTPFSYGWRQVQAAQTEGVALDTAGRTNAMFKTAKKLESIALDGDSSIVVGSDPLYGLRTHPKRNVRSTGTALNGATGPEWLAEVNATTQLLYNDNAYAEPTLYVNIFDWKYARETDYSTQYPNKTIAQRVLESGIQSVVPASDVSPGELIAVIKSKQYVEVLNGMPIFTQPLFRPNPMDPYDFATMAAAAVQIKFDADDNSGIAHSSL